MPPEDQLEIEGGLARISLRRVSRAQFEESKSLRLVPSVDSVVLNRERTG